MTDYVEKWKIKKLIDKLETSQGDGTSMITLLIPTGAQLSKISKMLTNEYGTASNIKSHTNKLAVMSGIKSAQEKLKLFREIPENGLAIYVGNVLTDDNRDKRVSVAFEPFRPLNCSLYRCDSKFHVEPLYALLSDDDSYGFIIVDGSICLYGIVSGNTSKVLLKFTAELPKKHSKGGQSSQRFGRIRLEKRHNYLRKVAENATKLFIENDQPNVKGIILAGSSNFKKDLKKTDMFDIRLKNLVLNTFDISYGGEMGFQQAISLSSDTLKNVKIIEERKLLSKYFEEINMDSGKICYGIQDTIYAFESGNIETLIIYENLNTRRIVLESHDIKYVDDLSSINQEEYKIISDDLLIDWLIDNYKNHGCILEFVDDISPEGSQFVKGFGGIGGILRYVIDFPDNDDYDDDDYDDDDYI